MDGNGAIVPNILEGEDDVLTDVIFFFFFTIITIKFLFRLTISHQINTLYQIVSQLIITRNVYIAQGEISKYCV